MTDLAAHSQPQRDEPSIRTLIEHALIDHGYSPTNARILLDTVISTEQNPAARPTAGQDDSAVVAYHNSDRPGVLLCREHGERWTGMTPLTADDLPDGGLCTWRVSGADQCGRDVLISTPAVGQPAEAHDTDEAEILARAASDLCAFGYGEAAAFLRDRVKALMGPGAWVPQYGRPLTPEEQDAETLAAADTVEDER